MLRRREGGSGKQRGCARPRAAREARAEVARLRAHAGRHLRYEPGDRPGETEDAWLYLLGRRLYVIFARGGAPATRTAALHFVASVELLED